LATLPKRVAAIEEQLADHKTAVEKAKADLKSNEAERRKLEADIQTFQQKIVKYRGQSSGVKTNEEYKALMHEVEFAEKEISGCEDKILELMINLETQEKALKAAEAALKTEGAEVEKEKAEARTRTAEDQKLLEELGVKRNELRTPVSDSALAHYDRVLRQPQDGGGRSAGPEMYRVLCSDSSAELGRDQDQRADSDLQLLRAYFYYDPASEPAAPPEAPPKKKSKAAAKNNSSDDAGTTEESEPASAP